MLYTITGLPYSGKSTLREELVKRFHFKVISIDEIMDDKDMWREGHPTDDDWNEAYSVAYEKLKQYLKEGKDVLFDGGSLKFQERETQRKIAEEFAVEHKLIFINTPVKEILERKLRNKHTNERGQLTEEMMNTALNIFEEPKPDENPMFYNSAMNLDVWINKNI